PGGGDGVVKHAAFDVDRIRGECCRHHARRCVKGLLEVVGERRFGEVEGRRTLRVRLRTKRRLADGCEGKLQWTPLQSDGSFRDQIMRALMIDQRPPALRRNILEKLRVALTQNRQRLEREASAGQHGTSPAEIALRSRYQPVRREELVFRSLRTGLIDGRGEERAV